LELRPRNADALTALAQKALDAGQLDQAGCCIHALVEYGPGIPARQLVERGLAVARQAGDAKSIKDFEQLLARTPQ
jgi:thioredoxin-like negative regulator of GroEL